VQTGACTVLDKATTGCAGISSGGVHISGESTSGSGGSGGSSDAGAAGDDSGSGDVGGVTGPACAPGVACGTFGDDIGGGADPGAPPVVVTIGDVADFVPAAGVGGMEPSGWAIVGLPANFYSTVGRSVQSGEVLGRPASVRFTPAAFDWDFGDGAALHSGTGGDTWAALGLPEFSDTPTSHVFGEAGSYTIALTVRFSAEYRFGEGAWIPLDGTVPSTAAPLTAIAANASTVIVGGDCASGRAGSPGC
jgi:hypothetical protein